MKKYEGNLLVVDDFELNRDMLCRRLRTRGFNAQSADCGLNALQFIKEDKSLDLVLLDIMMPDMNGYELLTKIREKYSPSELVVIMVTAKDQSEDIVKALQLGADDYITKPIDFPVALARISNQLSRRIAQRALRESEERYALAAQGANDGLWDWDISRDHIFYSDRWKTMLGYSPDDIGNTIDEWFNRVHADDLIRLKTNLEYQFSGETAKLTCEYRMLHKDGTWRWMLTRGVAVKGHSAQVHRMVGWQTDTSQRVEHDRLTSLPNRGLFLDRLDWAMAKGMREPDENFAVFYMGLDRFKVINEVMGHERGDAILQQVARRLEKLIRPQDTLARMGGDEFALLVETSATPGNTTLIAERIAESVGRGFLVGDSEAHLTVSIGIVLGGKAEDSSELLRMAHRTMELAKKSGKDTYIFYEEGLDSNQVSVLKMENRLRKALELDELFLMYQPQIDTQSGMIIGAEALLRWRNSEEGLVPPFKFIPLAEETGLIEPIGTWVIQEACRQNKAWQDAGLPKIRVAVNVSSRQFRNADKLLQVVESSLQETGLDAKWLDLELTESLLSDNVTKTRDYLNRFHALGCHLSLDDFGTGYSSLSYLKKFPIDTLKIDQSFVRDITTDPDDAAICSAVISMAHSLRMSVMAEGVETEEHLKFLKDLRCDQMQGYHFSKPTTPNEIVQLLSENAVFLPNQV